MCKCAKKDGWMSKYEFDEHIVLACLLYSDNNATECVCVCLCLCIGFAKLILDNQFNKVADNSLNTSAACGGHEMWK